VTTVFPFVDFVVTKDNVGETKGELYFDLHSTTQVVSRLHATVLGRSCATVV
jgi:hypothetical protein